MTNFIHLKSIIMRQLLLIGLVFICYSCVSVPKAAPELSQELGTELTELKESHLALVHHFFDNQREKIQNFINEEWMPLFAKNFFEQPAIDNTWKEVVNSGKKNDRLEFIKRVYPEIQLQVNKKYEALSTPLDALENKLVMAINQKYENAQSINQSLTAFLNSAAETSKIRTVTLNKVGMDQATLDNIINQVNHTTREALQGAENIKDIETQVETYKDQLNDLLSNF